MVETIINWFRTYEFVAIWLEGIALVAIFFWDRLDNSKQHKEILAQLEVSQKQTEALIDSERAWILADIAKLPNFQPDPNQVQFLWIFPTIKNYGKTPARIKRIVGIVKLISEDEQLPTVPEYIPGQGFDQRIDTVLPPGIPIQPRLVLSGDEFIKIRVGKLTLYIHGFIEYLDIGRTERRTAYCFAYLVQSGFSPAESGFYPCLEVPTAYTECT
jgi:hypothetical protein